MRLLLLAVGRLKDGPERDLVARYGARAKAAGRSLGFSGPDMLEVAESRAARPADRKAEEARAILERAGDAALVALDEDGAAMDSAGFAALLQQRRDAGQRALALVVGGADGLDPALLQGAAARIAFGRMTLPHQIVRALAAEQLYRAMTILSGHPYHRA
jgi:23S rRNA (pseudouridine1915-N3)-methyltransferase